MKQGPDALDADYFLDAQDFDDLWAKNRFCLCLSW
jgi:hypothetical protein